MEKKELQTIIGEGLGEASMCWSETPKGIFDDGNCLKINTRINEAVDKYVVNQSSKHIKKFSEVMDILEKYHGEIGETQVGNHVYNVIREHVHEFTPEAKVRNMPVAAK